jgi:lipoyl(octanoyl) transferase
MELGAIDLRDLGADVDYGAAATLQDELHAGRVAGTVGDTLLLLEHRPIYTLGRSADASHILLDAAELERLGIARISTSRGGDVTYHGPGQLVGYPIIHLGGRSLGVLAYITAVEEALIRTLADFGVPSGRDPRNRGVWVGNDKIAAIGIRVSRQVTMHGFALNVNTRLDDYRGIVPCGLTAAGVTSMARVIGRPVDMAGVKTAVFSHFRAIFGYP